jgi:hypothetical protein
MKSLKYTMYLTVAVALTVAVNVGAGEKAIANPALSVLSTATSAELPAKAADLVAHADVKTLKQTAIDVVKAAVGLNPAAAPAIVSSIAQASPDMAATASATAVALVPNQAIAIARAAAAAAPTKAGAIVEAICRVVPSNYQKVANAVAEVVPGASKEILAGIAAAIPQLKNAIDQTLAGYGGNIPLVSTVLTQVAQIASPTIATLPLRTPESSPGGSTPPTPVVLPQGPSAGPPQVPISGTPPVHDPGTGTPAPPGGHNYSGP